MRQGQPPEPLYDGPLARLLRSTFDLGRPDPWPAEMDAAVRLPTAIPLCVNCLAPQQDHYWFCGHCASPTGDHVMLLPSLQVFCVGEVLRRGVMGPPDRQAGVLAFLFVYSASQYAFFAPVYWFWMIRKWQGKPICTEIRKPIESHDLDPST